MDKLSLKEIIDARDRCAQIIALYGARYLPIFERLEHEIELEIEKQNLLNKAISISKNGTQNGTQNGTHLSLVFNSKN